jgi:hypothetical protein
MLLAIIPGLLSIVLFVATLSLRPQRARATVLPPRPMTRSGALNLPVSP